MSEKENAAQGGIDNGAGNGAESASKDNNLFPNNAFAAKLKAHTERQINSTPEPIRVLSKSEILQSLVKTFKPLDFLVLKYPTETTEQIKVRHEKHEPLKASELKVLLINEILKAAKANNWNLCKHGGECYVYNGTF
jgi:hypothetical protein